MTVVLETVLGFVARPYFYAATLVSFFLLSLLSLLILSLPSKNVILATNRLEIY